MQTNAANEINADVTDFDTMCHYIWFFFNPSTPNALWELARLRTHSLPSLLALTWFHAELQCGWF